MLQIEAERKLDKRNKNRDIDARANIANQMQVPLTGAIKKQTCCQICNMHHWPAPCMYKDTGLYFCYVWQQMANHKGYAGVPT